MKIGGRAIGLATGAVAGWSGAVWLTARIGISSRTGYDEYRYEHYLPFLAAWAVVIGCTALLISPLLVRRRKIASAVIVAMVVAAGLYYGIGRPFEIQLLRDQTVSAASGTFFNPTNELLLPVLIGILPAAIASLIFGMMAGDAPLSDVLVAGLATYLAIGVLLWLQAAVAWTAIGLWTGSYPSPVTEPWVRFADEAGPQYAIWYLTVWPLLVVACCG